MKVEVLAMAFLSRESFVCHVEHLFHSSGEEGLAAKVLGRSHLVSGVIPSVITIDFVEFFVKVVHHVRHFCRVI